MKNGSSVERARPRLDLLFECERMRPSVIAKHTNRKMIVERWRVFVVVTDGGHTAEQVANPSPPKAGGFVDFPQAADWLIFGTVDIERPLMGVRVRAISKPRK